MQPVGVQADQSSSDDHAVDRHTILQIARNMRDIVSLMDSVTQKAPEELRSDPIVGRGLQYIKVLKDVLDESIQFLDSPLVERTSKYLWPFLIGLRGFVEVGAGIVISSFFVAVGQELLDVNEKELGAAKQKLKQDIDFVEMKLPEIEKQVSDVAEQLKSIRAKVDSMEPKELDRVLWQFRDGVRIAKLDIDDCEEKLTEASKTIDATMAKISAKTFWSGVFRGVILVGGEISIWYLFSNKKMNLMSALLTGGAWVPLALLVKIPRYTKLKEDFIAFKEVKDSLHCHLNRLKKRLESHESIFDRDFARFE